MVERGMVPRATFKKRLIATPCASSISDEVVNAANAAFSRSRAAASQPAAFASAIASFRSGV